MPFWTGAMGSHDDGSHQGSAKRGTASGVKGIDAAQNLTPKVVMADINAAIVNAANGVAGLDAGAKVPVANLPAGLNTANLLAAIAPTMSNWGTNPDTPAQIAGELDNTLTTAGVSNAPAPGLKYDLGASKRVVVSSFCLVTAVSGTMQLQISDDDATYYTVVFAALNTTVGQYSVVVKARYLHFLFASSRTHTKLRCGAYNI